MDSPYFVALAKLMDEQGIQEFTVNQDEVALATGRIIVTWSPEKLCYIITRHKGLEP